MPNILPNIRSSKIIFNLFFNNQIFCFTRKQRRREQPTTPNKYRKCSRRCFDGQLRTWRRNLHQFDEPIQQDPAEIIDTNENDAE
jgi:hypothetical protein